MIDDPLSAAALSPHPAAGWRDDARFFLTCYLAGLAFFLVMLS